MPKNRQLSQKLTQGEEGWKVRRLSTLPSDEPLAALDALLKPTLHDALVQFWSSDGQAETVLMVTHNIDEVLRLSHRIVVMGDGSAVTIRQVMEANIPRPRDRRAMPRTPVYVELKERLLGMLSELQ